MTNKGTIARLRDIRAIWDHRRANGKRTPTEAAELMSRELSALIVDLSTECNAEAAAEQIIAHAALDADTALPDAPYPEEQAADIAKLAAERLRDAGLLVRAPTDEQIEQAALALHDRQWRNSDTHPRWGEGGHCLSESGHRTEVMEDANAALTAAAGVAPQETSAAEHIAALTSMLKSIEWQINRDSGSQWLAGELYEHGARAPQGHLRRGSEMAQKGLDAQAGTGSPLDLARGPARIEMMPPSPETSTRWYSMYCRECGIEEGMAHEHDAPMLIEKRDRHNAKHHAAPQEPRKAIHEPSFNRVYCVRCGAKWPCQPAPQEPRVEYLEVGHPSGERQPAYVESTAREKPSRVDTEWISEQRHLGWPDMHPEDYCHICGRENQSWCAESREDWLAATEAWAAETGREGICCVVCFTRMYRERTGHDPIWMLRRFDPTPSPDREKLITEAYNVVTGDGGIATPEDALDVLNRLYDAAALAAQPVLDPERVKTWLQREFGSVLAHDPHNPDRFWGGSASALCEAAKRGELS